MTPVKYTEDKLKLTHKTQKTQEYNKIQKRVFMFSKLLLANPTAVT